VAFGNTGAERRSHAWSLPSVCEAGIHFYYLRLLQWRLRQPQQQAGSLIRRASTGR
jgi:hypothetical protein